MPPLKIRYPIWKTRSVGIAEFKIGQADIDLEIEYRDKTGNRLYPHIYTVSREKLAKCPVQIFRNNVRVRVISIKDLDIKEYRSG